MFHYTRDYDNRDALRFQYPLSPLKIAMCKAICLSCVCTRGLGHTGKHAAHNSYGAVLATWDDGDNEREAS